MVRTRKTQAFDLVAQEQDRLPPIGVITKLGTTKSTNSNQKDAKAAEQKTLLHPGRMAKPILLSEKRAKDEN
jgi:hypothetical protein